MSFDYLKIKYPPTIISFQDAMKLLKMARDAYKKDVYEDLPTSAECFLICEEIAKAFERKGG